jgi:hypothetical protein
MFNDLSSLNNIGKLKPYVFGLYNYSVRHTEVLHSYIYICLAFPRVKHLILADPWGFPEKPADIVQRFNIPLWVRAIAFVIQPFNPLWPVRVAGPFGKQ